VGLDVPAIVAAERPEFDQNDFAP